MSEKIPPPYSKTEHEKVFTALESARETVRRVSDMHEAGELAQHRELLLEHAEESTGEPYPLGEELAILESQKQDALAPIEKTVQNLQKYSEKLLNRAWDEAILENELMKTGKELLPHVRDELQSMNATFTAVRDHLSREVERATAIDEDIHALFAKKNHTQADVIALGELIREFGELRDIIGQYKTRKLANSHKKSRDE